jgi:ParB family chromosome partitioning protein
MSIFSRPTLPTQHPATERNPEIVKPRHDFTIQVDTVESIDTRKIAWSDLPNRATSNFSDDDFLELKESIRRNGGNLVPVKLRLDLREYDEEVDNNPVYEVVYGHRRVSACRLLGLPVQAFVVTKMPDDQVLLERLNENSGRADFTPYELGLLCCELMKSRNFANQKQLAAEIGKDEGLVSKAIQLARLPREVIDVFSSPIELQYRYAKPLTDALERDPTRVVEVARDILNRKLVLPTSDCIAWLTAVESATIEPFNSHPASRDIMSRGKSVGHIEIDAKGRVRVALKRQLDASAVDALHSAMLKFLAALPNAKRTSHQSANKVTKS